MIVPEPRCEGAFQVTVTCSLAEVTPVIVGAVGRVSIVGEEKDESELPIIFFAVTRNSYAFPAINPVTVADVAVDVPSANVAHVPEPSTLYSTM